MLQLDWNAAKDALRASLPVTQFKNWLHPVKLIRCDDHSVVLGVPSRFHEQWLRNNYGDQLLGAIKNQVGLEPQLEFEVLAQESSPCPEETERFATAPVVITPTLRPKLHVVESEIDPDDHRGEPPLRQPNLPAINRPFYESEYNRVALKCSELFAKGEGLNLNPLIIYAGVGMGKTHLLTMIGQKLAELHPEARVRYCTLDMFGGEFVDSLKDNTAIINFRRKYRYHTDILLFDDLQAIGPKKKTQDELLYSFNEITARGGRIVFTTTIPPHRIEGLNEALKSRLLSGVIAEIKYPSSQERVALLEKTCEQNGISIDPIVLRTLANQGQKDVRELIGNLLGLHLRAQLENQPISQQFLAREGIVQETKKEAVTLDEIISLVEYNFGIDRATLASKSRKESINWARQVGMYLARRYTLLPLEEIGKAFGRDHATVIHAFQKVTEKVKSYPSHRYEVEFLDQKLHQRAPSVPLH